MKITVVGASGLIGSKLAAILKREGHDVVAASRSSGVDVISGEGLADALAAADALVDVTNPPDSGADAVLRFFSTSATNVVNAARQAGVGHYVVLSIVGVDGLPDSGYYRAKVAQETIIAASGLPYTIVRATQFVEFTDEIVESLVSGNEVRVPDALIQPIPADEVAAALARAAVTAPRNGVMEIGGPQRISFAQMARDVLARRGDPKTVIVDDDARYFGARLATDSLVIRD